MNIGVENRKEYRRLKNVVHGNSRSRALTSQTLFSLLVIRVGIVAAPLCCVVLYCIALHCVESYCQDLSVHVTSI